MSVRSEKVTSSLARFCGTTVPELLAAEAMGCLPFGKILRTHGLRGALRVKLSPFAVAGFDGGLYWASGDAVNVVEVKDCGGGEVLLNIAGVGNLDAARALRGKSLLMKRLGLDLPYELGLVGAKLAVLEDGEIASVSAYVVGMAHFGAGWVADVMCESGKENWLIPCNDEFFVDLPSGGKGVHLPVFFESEASDI